MQAALSLGSNLGDRLSHLNQAAALIHKLPDTNIVKASSAYENPPLLPKDAPADWYQLFLNCAVLIQTRLPAQTLLQATQQIEKQLQRHRQARWSPRTIDIDLITYADDSINTDTLTLPHPGACSRNFVLAPLMEIAPQLLINRQSVLHHYRALSEKLPAWMQIVNVTPDSFSGDGLLDQTASGLPDNPNYIDLGAESTRPNAHPVSAEEEWSRLEPQLQKHSSGQWIRPKISIDTRHAATAAKAVAYGVDMINDVSGLADPQMLEVIAQADCDIAVMHNLGIPADPAVTLAHNLDPIAEVLAFLELRLQQLAQVGISNDRIWIDPGIGFGKQAEQSWHLLQNIAQLHQLGARVFVGHSRKSFLKTVTAADAAERDIHTVALSQILAQSAELIRVHNLSLHQQYSQTRWRMQAQF